MNRYRSIAIAVALMAASFAPGLSAEQQPSPVVAVIGFSADGASKLSPKSTDAMAEALAVQLVESGRYRVLDRTWLGIPGSQRRPSADSQVIGAAREAGVDYLVAGRVEKYSEVHRVGPSGPSVLLPMFGRPMRGAVRPGIPTAGTRRTDHLRVTVELIDAKSGSVLTSMSSTCPVPPRGSRDAALERATATIGQTLIRWVQTTPGMDSRNPFPESRR